MLRISDITAGCSGVLGKASENFEVRRHPVDLPEPRIRKTSEVIGVGDGGSMFDAFSNAAAAGSHCSAALCASPVDSWDETDPAPARQPGLPLDRLWRWRR